MNIQQNTIIEYDGIDSLKKIVRKNGSFFREIHKDTDIGHDSYIEFLVPTETGYQSTGIEVKVQVKSGKSYFNKDYAFIKGDKEHFEYWKNHILPTIGIVYNPETEKLYWVNITEYIFNNSECKSYNIPCRRNLNSDNFEDFRNECINYCRKDKNRISTTKRIEMLYSDNVEEAQLVLKTLFLLERNTQLFWNIIISYLSICKEKSILEGIVYYLSIAIGDQVDVFWHKDNIINDSIQAWLTDKFNQIVTENLLYKILSVIQPEIGINRGTIGGLIILFIKKIKSRKQLLIKIFENTKYDFYIRNIALMYYLSETNNEEAINWLQQQLALINNEQLPLNLSIPIYYEFKEEFLLYLQIISEQGGIYLF